MSATADMTLAELAPIIRAYRRWKAERCRAYTMRNGSLYLYAIQAGANGPVKIGVAKNPDQRLKTLQTGNHEDLRGIAAWRCHPDEEKELHAVYATAHIRGEWFRPDDDLIAYLCDEGDPFEDWEGCW